MFWQLGRKPRLAVVLSGGAMLGAFEVGVIDVLARRGLTPDLLVGTSVGAVNAAYWALNPGPDVGEKLYQAWLDMDRRAVFPRNPWPAVQGLLRGRNHLLTSNGLLQVLERNLGVEPRRKLEESAVPVVVVAADAATGEKVQLRQGDAITAILASAAIPGIWPPVERDGRLLIDGGVVANLDLETALEAGATDLIAVDLIGPTHGPAATHLLNVVQRTINFTLRRQTDLALLAFRARARLALMRPVYHWSAGLGAPGEITALFEMGRAAAEELVAHHLRGRRVISGTLTPDLEMPPGLPRQLPGPVGALAMLRNR